MLFVHFFYKKSLHSSNIYDILHIEHTFYKGKGVDKNEHTNYNVEEQKCMSENEDKKAKRHQEDLERLRGDCLKKIFHLQNWCFRLLQESQI